MGIMCKSRTITIDGLGEITARELTTAEVRDIRDKAGKIENRPLYMAEMLLIEERFLMEAATLSTGMSAEQFEGELPPSAVAQIWEAVCEVNHFLHRFLTRAAAGVPLPARTGD